MEKLKIYYAHPIGIYGSSQESRDIAKIKSSFEDEDTEVEVVNPGSEEIQKSYNKWLKSGMKPEDHKMRFFKELVLECNGIVFRGDTPGVRYEVSKAREADIPIIQVDRL